MVKPTKGKPIYGFQSRVIKVTHPYVKDDKGEPVILMEAHVKVINIRKDLVTAIRKVEIKYDLKESN
jgi:hypothetical protein